MIDDVIGHLSNFLCCGVFCVHSVSCVPNVASVSELFIRIVHSVFSQFSLLIRFYLSILIAHSVFSVHSDCSFGFLCPFWLLIRFSLTFFWCQFDVPPKHIHVHRVCIFFFFYMHIVYYWYPRDFLYIFQFFFVFIKPSL